MPRLSATVISQDQHFCPLRIAAASLRSLAHAAVACTFLLIIQLYSTFFNKLTAYARRIHGPALSSPQSYLLTLRSADFITHYYTLSLSTSSSVSRETLLLFLPVDNLRERGSNILLPLDT